MDDICKDKKISITIEVNAEDLTKGISEIISSLSVEERVSMYKGVLFQYFETVDSMKFLDAERKVMEICRNRHTYWSDKQLKETDTYKNLMNDISNTKEGIMTIFKTELLEYAKTYLNNFVYNDERVITMMESVKNEIAKNINTIVLNAISTNIANNIVLNSENIKQMIFTNFYELYNREKNNT
jgi:hypothetical protein